LAHQGAAEPTVAVAVLLKQEIAAGLETLEAYADFQQRAEAAKHSLLEFLLKAKREGRSVLGYGAAAKGNTLLNYAGIKPDLLAAVADRAPSKQGKCLPGNHIPVISPEQLATRNPDALLVLPWNLIGELRQQLPGQELVTAIPELQVWTSGN
jgi:C-methyltransferase C-terminal domain